MATQKPTQGMISGEGAKVDAASSGSVSWYRATESIADTSLEHEPKEQGGNPTTQDLHHGTGMGAASCA